ncbi:hypothetical protein PENSPDRAFT_616461 [Peniophora sp. CONT]|nr:hypothetical protein PENSPDRAFT_616461 [Peniophora sp. CONT]
MACLHCVLIRFATTRSGLLDFTLLRGILFAYDHLSLCERCRSQCLSSTEVTIWRTNSGVRVQSVVCGGTRDFKLYSSSSVKASCLRQVRCTRPRPKRYACASCKATTVLIRLRLPAQERRDTRQMYPNNGSSSSMPYCKIAVGGLWFCVRCLMRAHIVTQQ